MSAPLRGIGKKLSLRLDEIILFVYHQLCVNVRDLFVNFILRTFMISFCTISHHGRYLIS